ncbi:MAG: DnaJ domain-containing protein [Deltaproteobacteria bacterium]|nr:DnaJ domain-containing protein [Deltaproteobacteria bacterium]
MALNEQASAYRKHRGADDKPGNLAWASRVGSKALRVSPEAATRDVEALFELSEEEKLVWRTLRLARRYTDLEHSGLMPVDQLRSVLRGFVAADVVDMVESDEAKALIPAELKKLRAELLGKEWRPAIGGLQAKVYRPDISTSGEGVAVPSSSEGAPVVEVEKPVEKPKPTLVLNGQEKKLKEQLSTAVATLKEANHYIFLGVAQTANESTIRTAYVNLARDYHPDRLSGTALADDPESRSYVDVLFKRLGDANKTLGNQESRARYDRELAALAKVTSPSKATDARPRRPVEARQAYTMGESFFKKKDYKTAEMHYRQATMFDPDEPLILVALAWCIYLNPDHAEDHRIADARRRLEEVLKKHKTAEAAYKLGRVLKDARDDAAAVKRFQEALTYNPGHTDAQRELRLAEGRKQKADEEKQKIEDSKKNILQKLFKR